MTQSRGSPSRTRLSQTKSVQDSPNLLSKFRTNCNQETNGVFSEHLKVTPKQFLRIFKKKSKWSEL